MPLHFKVSEANSDRVVMHHGESPATLTLAGMPDGSIPELGAEFMVTFTPVVHHEPPPPGAAEDVPPQSDALSEVESTEPAILPIDGSSAEVAQQAA